MFEIGLSHYLSVAAILFALGVFGIFLNRKNVIVILMSIELILLAVNINLVAFSAELNDLVGQIFAMFVLTVAAAEAAIGLAVLVVFFRNRGSIAVEDSRRLLAAAGRDHCRHLGVYCPGRQTEPRPHQSCRSMGHLQRYGTVGGLVDLRIL